MNNSTNSNDLLDQTTLTRPDWMSPETWRDIRDKIADKLEELVENAQVSEQRPLTECTEIPWCNVPTPVGAVHDGSHGGDIVPLAHANFDADTGFWCWLHEDRGTPGRPRVYFEGRWITDQGADTWNYQMPAGQVAMLLWALETPAAVQALQRLLGLVGSVAEVGDR